MASKQSRGKFIAFESCPISWSSFSLFAYLMWSNNSSVTHSVPSGEQTQYCQISQEYIASTNKLAVGFNRQYEFNDRLECRHFLYPFMPLQAKQGTPPGLQLISLRITAKRSIVELNAWKWDSRSLRLDLTCPLKILLFCYAKIVLQIVFSILKGKFS